MSKTSLRTYCTFISVFLACSMLFCGSLKADRIPVRHIEGETHGFVTLRSSDDRIIGVGEWLETGNCVRMTSRLTIHFNDGSLYDETTVFSQRRLFRMLTDHLVEKGPSFKQPMETWIDANGKFKGQYADKDGKQKAVTEKLKLSDDAVNGMVSIILKDVDPKAAKTTVSMVVATPKPRIVHLVITPDGERPFYAEGSPSEAIHYVIKVDLGGAAGVVAPLVGKQPPNTDAWIVGGIAPLFVREEGPLYEGGPVWSIEPISLTPSK